MLACFSCLIFVSPVHTQLTRNSCGFEKKEEEASIFLLGAPLSLRSPQELHPFRASLPFLNRGPRGLRASGAYAAQLQVVGGVGAIPSGDGGSIFSCFCRFPFIFLVAPSHPVP